MPTEISRRAILGGLAATATLATTGCNRPTHSGRVNLICQGMLMFHWVNTDAERDYINILMPDPPIVNGEKLPHEAHKLLFSEWRGGKASRLFTPGDFELVLQGNFKRSNSKWTGPVTSEEVVLNTANAARFRTGCTGPLQLNEVRKHRYAIRVPYPTQVLARRRTTFGGTAYNQGPKTAEDFHVDTQVLAGVHVFVYDGVEAQALFRYLPNVVYDQKLGPAGVPQSLNLYMYSEPDNWQDMFVGHIQQFNQLVKYGHHDGTATQQVQLDLSPIGRSQGTEPPKAEDDLEAEDLMNLVELAFGQIAPEHGETHLTSMVMNPATTKAVASVPSVNESQINLAAAKATANVSQTGAILAPPDGGGAHIMLADPVECLQGWGT